MEFDDYESLPNNISSATHMLAGAFAGIMEHTIMYPVDSVKTRMQALNPNPKARYRSIREAFSKIISQEGILKPMRGINAVVLGAGPAHALYFSCYEKMKRVISGTQHGIGNPIAQGFAGCFATVLHDAIMNPAEVVKQRMQIYSSPYKTCLDCLVKVYKSEGAHAFYRSYTTQLAMNIPFQSIHFMTYEFLQDLTNHNRTYNPKAHMLCGAIAGAFAAAATTPLDVCKTLLNTHTALNCSKQVHINGFLSAVIAVYKFNGLKGYFRGLQARVIYQVPSTAIAWSVYEFFKYALHQRQQKHSHNYNNEHIPMMTHGPPIEEKSGHIIAYSK